MLQIPLVEPSYWVRNILGENLYLINSDKNQITSTQMWIQQPCQFSWRAPYYMFDRALNVPPLFGISQNLHFSEW